MSKLSKFKRSKENGRNRWLTPWSEAPQHENNPMLLLEALRMFPLFEDIKLNCPQDIEKQHLNLTHLEDHSFNISISKQPHIIANQPDHLPSRVSFITLGIEVVQGSVPGFRAKDMRTTTPVADSTKLSKTMDITSNLAAPWNHGDGQSYE